MGLALPFDLTDGKWAVLERFLAPPSDTGRPQQMDTRRAVEAILYLLRGSLPWRMLPLCFPPVSSTVQRWFFLWCDVGVWKRINPTYCSAFAWRKAEMPRPALE